MPDIDHLSCRLADLRKERRVDVLPLHDISSLQIAYEVQDAAVEAFASPQRGYTITGTDSASRRRLGLGAPIYGSLLDSELIKDGHEFRLPAGTIGLGCELSFVMGVNFPDHDERIDVQGVINAIASCYAGIRILGRRVSGTIPLNEITAAADFGLNVAFLRGPKIDAWDREGFPGLDVSASVDGIVLSRGMPGEVFRNALNAIVWLAEALRSQDRRLEAGMEITTGSCTTILQVSPGHVFSATFGDMPPIEIKIV